MISYKYRCIFIHIPRTGGSSLEDMIWRAPKWRTKTNLWMGYVKPYYNKYQTGGMQHLLATQVRQEVGSSVFDNYFKFTIVRNPWDKVVSNYLYVQTRPDLLDWIGLERGDSLARYLTQIQTRTHVQWEHQHKFVYDDHGNLLADYVGRFESYRESVDAILKQIDFQTHWFNIEIRKLPHVNKSVRKPYRDYFDDETREMVQTWHAQDIELFDYTY